MRHAPLDRHIAEIGGLAEALLADSVHAIRRRTPADLADFQQRAGHIDRLERELTDRIVARFAGGSDREGFRTGLAALRVAGHLKRIGGHGIGLARGGRRLRREPPMPPVPALARMADRASVAIQRVLDAYLTRDPAMAADIRAGDLELDRLHTALFRDVLALMRQRPTLVPAGTRMLFAAKTLERVGDHVTAIAEYVALLVTGAVPAETRPTADLSSLHMPGREAPCLPPTRARRQPASGPGQYHAGSQAASPGARTGGTAGGTPCIP